MSVIFTPRARSSRWKALWPLALLLAVSIIGGIWLWRAWPQVLMQSAVWQGCRCWGLASFTGCFMP